MEELLNQARETRETAFRELRVRLHEFYEICIDLAAPGNAREQWRRIVLAAQQILKADGCTLYRLEDEALHYEILLSDKLGIRMGTAGDEMAQFQPIPLRKADGSYDRETFAVVCAAESRLINIPDVTRGRIYEETRTFVFDQKMGYRTRSVLSVPIRYRLQPIWGVLQFVNPKNVRGEVVDFDPAQEEAAQAIAALITLSVQGLKG
jgi:hypothetical protein